MFTSQSPGSLHHHLRPPFLTFEHSPALFIIVSSDLVLTARDVSVQTRDMGDEGLVSVSVARRWTPPPWTAHVLVIALSALQGSPCSPSVDSVPPGQSRQASDGSDHPWHSYLCGTRQRCPQSTPPGAPDQQAFSPLQRGCCPAGSAEIAGTLRQSGRPRCVVPAVLLSPGASGSLCLP